MKELEAGIYHLAFNERHQSHIQRFLLKKEYDKVIVIDDDDEDKILEIRIKSPDCTKNIALLIFEYTQPNNYAVTIDNKIFMVFEDIFCIFNPQSCMIEKMQKADIGPVFAVYPYNGDFILHGELSICRVSRALDVLWTFRARDIFLRENDDPAFEMKSDRICLYDWLEYCYEISYDGVLLTEHALKKHKCSG